MDTFTVKEGTKFRGSQNGHYNFQYPTSFYMTLKKDVTCRILPWIQFDDLVPVELIGENSVMLPRNCKKNVIWIRKQVM